MFLSLFYGYTFNFQYKIMNRFSPISLWQKYHQTYPISFYFLFLTSSHYAIFAIWMITAVELYTAEPHRLQFRLRLMLKRLYLIRAKHPNPSTSTSDCRRECVETLDAATLYSWPPMYSRAEKFLVLRRSAVRELTYRG